jgi:hypothetical protein
LAKLKQEIRTMKPKPEPIVPLSADGVITFTPKADPADWKSSSSNIPPPLNTFSSLLISTPVEASQPQPRRNNTRGSHKRENTTFKMLNSLSSFGLYFVGRPF